MSFFNLAKLCEVYYNAVFLFQYVAEQYRRTESLSLGTISFNFVRSTQIRTFPFDFGIVTMPAV